VADVLLPDTIEALRRCGALVDTATAAHFLKISPALVARSIRRGDLPCVRLSNRVRIPTEALIRLAEGGAA